LIQARNGISPSCIACRRNVSLVARLTVPTGTEIAPICRRDQ
jgi:hypothetical protein